MSAVPDFEELRRRCVGRSLPGGTVVLRPSEAWLGDDAMLARHSPGALGAMWLLVVGLRGMGTSIEELVAMADAKMEDGVLFGELTLEERVPLVVDRTYAVHGGITDLVRKASGRGGVFDILEFRLEIRDGDRVDGLVTSAFVLQRSFV